MASAAAALVGTAVSGGLLALITREPKLETTSKPYRDLPDGYKTDDAFERKAIESFERAQELPLLPWLRRNIRPVMASYITLVHILAAVGLALLPSCQSQTLVAVGVFYMLSGLGITAGHHRLWSHTAYKAAAPYRYFLMLCSSLANQGTIAHWSRDHRVHHKYSETKADPHNALRGFLFAHVGWLFLRKDPRVMFAGRKLSVADIEALPEVALQARLNPWWNLFWCFGVPTLVPWLGWGENPVTAFFVTGALRYVLVLHGTWLVNSAAHLFGGHPYDEHSNPAENPGVAILSMGEGWHNWHHAYPYDYAASELGVSSQFNPTKLFIDAGAALGLVFDRRRALKQWEARKQRKGVVVELSGPPLLRQQKKTAL